MGNKFKVGDKVRCIKSISDREGGPIEGSEYIVTSVNNAYVGFPLPTLSEDDYLDKDVKDGIIPNWGIHLFELVHEEPSIIGAGLNLRPETGGTKADSGKPDISLIPTDAIWGMAAALTYGANKYARHNFRKGINYSRLVAAAMRHLTAWNEGENVDPESGLSHLDHAMASLGMLKFMDVNKPEMDDRYKVDASASILIQEGTSLYEIAKDIQRRGR